MIVSTLEPLISTCSSDLQLPPALKGDISHTPSAAFAAKGDTSRAPSAAFAAKGDISHTPSAAFAAKGDISRAPSAAFAAKGDISYLSQPIPSTVTDYASHPLTEIYALE